MNSNITEYGMIYGTCKTSYGSYAIITANVTMYLIVGKDKALLIDTAYGQGDLPSVIKEITDLPIIVVNTHGHYDHTSGNAFFPEVYMGEGGEEPALACEMREKLPYPDYKINHLKDGMVFDLGGETIECIAIGAHHKSSFAFLHKEGRTLYSGDEIEAGQVLLMVHGEDISDVEIAKKHHENMAKLIKRKDEFDRIATAHNGGPLETSYIDDYYKLSEMVISGTAVSKETCAGYGWPNTIFGGDEALKRVTYKKATFVLRK